MPRAAWPSAGSTRQARRSPPVIRERHTESPRWLTIAARRTHRLLLPRQSVFGDPANGAGERQIEQRKVVGHVEREAKGAPVASLGLLCGARDTEALTRGGRWGGGSGMRRVTVVLLFIVAASTVIR